MDTSGEINESLILYFGTFGMLLMAFAIIFFVVIYQRRLFAQQERMQKLDLETQQALLKASIQGQEEERERIAQDLHDEVGANLSTIKLYVGRLVSSLVTDADDPGNPLIDQTNAMVDETIQSVRHISHNLLPPVLKEFGLIEAIQDKFDKINHTGLIKTYFMHNSPTFRIPKFQELILYRVVQEMVNNTIKHAQASYMQLEIHYTEESLELVFQDDGVGFDLQKLNGQHDVTHSNGLGLQGIKSRISVLGGALEYDSAPGQGTRINIFVQSS